jgi:hypothetical protein
MKTLLALLLCPLALSCRAQEKENIALKLEKGKTYSFSMQVENHTTTRFDNKVIRSTFPVTFDADFFVEEANSAWFELKSTFHDISMKLLSSGDVLSFDTESTRRLLDSLARMPVEIELDRRGVVKYIGDITPLFDHFITLYPDDATMLAQLMGLVRDFVIVSIGHFVNAFPAYPVAGGESWTLEGPHNAGTLMPIPVTITKVYTLLESKREHWEISESSTLTPLANDTYVKFMGLEATANGEVTGTTTGMLKVDKKSGWLLSLNSKQESTGIVRVKSDDGTVDYDVIMEVKRSMSITGKVPK